MQIETKDGEVFLTFHDKATGDSRLKLSAVVDKNGKLGKLRALHEVTRQLDMLVASARSAISNEYRNIIELDESGDN